MLAVAAAAVFVYRSESLLRVSGTESVGCDDLIVLVCTVFYGGRGHSDFDRRLAIAHHPDDADAAVQGGLVFLPSDKRQWHLDAGAMSVGFDEVRSSSCIVSK